MAITPAWFDGGAFRAQDMRLTVGRFFVSGFLPRQDETDWFSLGVALVHTDGATEGRWADPGSELPLPLRAKLQPVFSGSVSHSSSIGTHFGTSAEYGWNSSLSIMYEPSVDRLTSERWSLRWFLSFPLVLNRRAHWVVRNRFRGRLSMSEGDDYDLFRLGGIGAVNPIQQAIDLDLLGYDALRGFPPNVFSGRQSHLWTVDVSVRPFEIFRGIGTFPFVLRRLTPALFADLGWIGPYRLSRDDVHVGIGAELRFELDVAYGFVPVLRAGWARGMGPNGRSQAYVVLGYYP